MAAKKATKSKSARVPRKAEPSRAARQESPTPPPSPIRRPMPWFGWLGLGIMVVNEVLLLLRVHPVAIIFTAIMWTGYTLFVDGWIWARGGTSFFLNREEKWPMLALISVLIWTMFEAFNFKMKAWEYFNSPDPFLRDVLYIWAFATIIPALLRTRTLYQSFDFFHGYVRWKIKPTPFWLSVSFIIGIAFIFIPVMLSDYWANFLVPVLWIGFILVIEPLNYRISLLENPNDHSDLKSVLRDLELGDISFFYQLLAAGLTCGILWETWNLQDIPYNGLIWYYYLNPIYWKLSLNLHIGAMPLLGFLGYPLLIWEAYAMWQLVKWILHGDLWKHTNA
jgi:hypothetical protein